MALWRDDLTCRRCWKSFGGIDDPADWERICPACEAKEKLSKHVRSKVKRSGVNIRRKGR